MSTAQQRDPIVRIYTFIFSYSLPSWSIPRDWIEFPVQYSRPRGLSIGNVCMYQPQPVLHKSSLYCWGTWIRMTLDERFNTLAALVSGPVTQGGREQRSV